VKKLSEIPLWFFVRVFSIVNGWYEKKIKISVCRTDPGRGQKTLMVYNFCCMHNTHSWMHCPDRTLKYLSFDIKLNAVAPIGAEIWSFDPFGSSRFGQSSSTHISKTGWPKNLKFWEYFFFTKFYKCTNFQENLRRSCQIWFKTVLIWCGIAQLLLLEDLPQSACRYHESETW